MDFNLNDEQRMIYGYGEKLARTWGHDYWMDKAPRETPAIVSATI